VTTPEVLGVPVPVDGKGGSTQPDEMCTVDRLKSWVGTARTADLD
jgi:hypothetical protein